MWWSFLFVLYLCLFQWLLYRSGDKGGKQFLPLSWGPIRDQAKSKLCPPVRAGKRGGCDSAFSTPCSTSTAGLTSSKNCFQKTQLQHSQEFIKTASVFLLKVHACPPAIPKALTKCPHKPLIAISPPHKSSLGKELTCCNLQAVPSLQSICWFTLWQLSWFHLLNPIKRQLKDVIIIQDITFQSKLFQQLPQRQFSQSQNGLTEKKSIGLRNY